MTTDPVGTSPALDPWTDLRERLERAAFALSDQSKYGPIGAEANAEQRRKDAKAEGVRLALSYMDEYDRAAFPEPPRSGR